MFSKQCIIRNILWTSCRNAVFASDLADWCAWRHAADPRRSVAVCCTRWFPSLSQSTYYRLYSFFIFLLILFLYLNSILYVYHVYIVVCITITTIVIIILTTTIIIASTLLTTTTVDCSRDSHPHHWTARTGPTARPPPEWPQWSHSSRRRGDQA